MGMTMTSNNWPAVLREKFGFSEFRKGQAEVLSALENHGRAVAVFPTGAGKSICYQLPALTYPGLTLVISPLIALMKDQIDFLRSRGIEAGRLDSSLTFEETRSVQDKINSGDLKLLYVSPERFKNERFLQMISRQPISLFAVDEAHCISEWGHNFRPDYLKLADIARGLRAERILALTATATPTVTRDICAAFDIPPEAAIVTGFYRANLKLAITPVTGEEREGLLVKRLQARAPGPTIVYVTLQKTANTLAAYLRSAGFPAEAYHAGMNTDERTAVQERWMASDRGIVVATIAFGMGIDKANVRYVYHFNLPKGIENYSQEIGRAGRDGADSVVEMFACPDDIPTLENFVYGDTPTHESIQALVTYLLSRGEQFDVSLYELSDKFDIRQLVLKTALTYLELLGAIKEGSPFYAGYRFYPTSTAAAVVAKFPGERGEFIKQLFARAKLGKKWYTLNPDVVAEGLGEERSRVVKALDYLHEQRDIVLEASEVRNRFTRLAPAHQAEELAAELTRRFAEREKNEIGRIATLLRLVEEDGCQTNALARYFGEERTEPCNNCLPCLTGKGRKLVHATPPGPLPGGLDVQAVQDVRAQHPTALGDSRQLARFLCGLSSPALSRARVTRHALFGVWEYRRFSDVLDFCEGLS